MRLKGLQPKTRTMHLPAMRDVTRFQGYAPDSAGPEELRAFQPEIKGRGVGVPTFNTRRRMPGFRRDHLPPVCDEARSAGGREVPVVPNAEEVTRIHEAAPGPGLRHRAAFSVAAWRSRTTPCLARCLDCGLPVERRPHLARGSHEDEGRSRTKTAR